MTDQWTDRLSEYLDGELPVPEREAIEAHLAGCAVCARTLDDLRRVAARAASMRSRVAPPPPPAVWEAVAAHARSTAPVAAAPRRRISLSLGQLAAAGLLLALVSGGGVWLALDGRPDRPASVAARGTDSLRPVEPIGAASTGSSLTSATFADPSYEEAVGDLEAAFVAGRDRLRPETMQVLEANLRTIDAAIADARRALEADPASAYLNEYLAATMQRKLRLLRRAVAIAGAQT